ncbi:MAG TPA: nucleotidyltransferase family protein [Syntrophales bacterium]|nr:nucleotidyltransferase family protein [Syntrophales bacterium]
MKPEIELLLIGSQSSPGASARRRVAEILAAGIDHQELSSLALQHGLAPLLYRNARIHFAGIFPADLYDHLRALYHVNSARCLRLTSALLKILEGLEAGGVKAMPYKGPALADFVYGNVALRHFNDLDILIRRCDVLRARDLMVAMGYRPEKALSRTQAVTFTRWNSEIGLSRDSGTIAVELQWNIVPGYFSFPVERLGLWENGQALRTRDFRIPTLPPEELLLVLCVHGCKDLWGRLIWAHDIAELIRQKEDLDWTRIMKLSRACGSHRMLCLGLRLAEDLFGPVLPGLILTELDEDPSVDRLARWIKSRLLGVHRIQVSLVKEMVFYWNVRERRQDRLGLFGKYAMNLLFGDWNPAPLPDYLFPVAYLLRPVTLIARYGEGTLRQFCRTGWNSRHAD